METIKNSDAAQLLGVTNKELYKTIYDRTVLNEIKLMRPSGRIEDVLISKPLIDKINERMEAYSSMLKDKEEIYLNKIMKIPEKEYPLVYFLFQEDYLIYIGQTFNFKNRIGEHKRTKEITSFAIEKQHRSDLSLMEALYINRYRPPLNKMVFNTNDIIKMIMDRIDLFGEEFY